MRPHKWTGAARHLSFVSDVDKSETMDLRHAAVLSLVGLRKFQRYLLELQSAATNSVCFDSSIKTNICSIKAHFFPPSQLSKTDGTAGTFDPEGCRTLPTVPTGAT